MDRPQPRMGTQGDVIGKRIAAFVIDLVVVGLATGVVLLVVGIVGGALGTLAGDAGRGVFAGITLVAVILSPVFVFAYFTYLQGKYGQTFGKRLLDIVVVKSDGADCDYAAAAIRTILLIFIDSIGFIVPYLVGLILIFVTDDNQRVGDIAAGTIVVEAE